MKFLALGKGLGEALQGLADKVKGDSAQTAIIGSKDEALVVMTWERFQELTAQANKPAKVEKEYIPTSPGYVPYIPINPYPIKWRDYWPYWGTTVISGTTSGITWTSPSSSSSCTYVVDPSACNIQYSLNTTSSSNISFPEDSTTKWLDI